MERRIWLYWENLPGRTEPPHITLCRETVRKNADVPVVIINPENLHEYLPDIHENVHHVCDKKNPDRVSLAIKTDFIRAFLLEKYGGLYLDSDAIVLQPLHEVFDAIEETGFACMRKTSRPQRRIPNNFIGATPGGRIISMFAAHLRYELEHRIRYEWGETGAKTLTPIVNGNLEHAAVFEEHRVHPITNNKQELFARKDLKTQDAIPEDALVCMLFHGIFDTAHPRKKGALARHSLHDLYYGDSLLADIFRTHIPEPAFRQLRQATPAAAAPAGTGAARELGIPQLLRRLRRRVWRRRG